MYVSIFYIYGGQMHPLNKISSPEIIAGLPAWPGKKLLSETNQKKMLRDLL